MPDPVLLLPTSHPVLQPRHRELPLFFLAGPIRGGDDWQFEMTDLLVKKTDGACIVVNPSRYESEHPLYAYRLSGNEDAFDNQTDWEAHFLHKAGLDWPQGCIIFWLPVESVTNPRPPEDGPYARDTRGEISEWRTHMMYRPDTRVVMGGHSAFPGIRVIERNNRRAVGDRLPIFRTLEEVADSAIWTARRGA